MLIGARLRSDPVPTLAPDYYIRSRARGSAVVYLLGDHRQRIYAWRGASNSFETAQATHEFSLSWSFRFGRAIAELATLVMQHGSGRSGPGVQSDRDTGSIEPSQNFTKGAATSETSTFFSFFF